MRQSHQTLRQLLAELKAELERQGLWQSLPPAPAALASHEPFCVDTLRFEQWLQWIMIPRFEAMIDAQLALPAHCSIAPYAQEALPDRPQVIALITRIDQLCSLA